MIRGCADELIDSGRDITGPISEAQRASLVDFLSADPMLRGQIRCYLERARCGKTQHRQECLSYRRGFYFAIVLLVMGSSLPQKAETNEGAVKSRDLSAMFYTDTLPVKKRPPQGNSIALERRIGLKSRILLRDKTCNIQEAPASRIFQSGEQIRLQLESNVDGYLYVAQKGSSGNDSMLFPDSRINGGENHVQRGILYSIPPASWFGFNDQPGEEHLLIVVSRTPLDGLPRRPQVDTLTAFNNLQRSMQPRDLVLFEEKAPQVGALPPATQSVIVVNTSETKNNVVYLELTLKHR